MLHTDDLIKFLWEDTYTRRYYGGVFPMDKLPTLPVKKHERLYLINEQESTLPGSHWLMLYLDFSADNAELLDSLGHGLFHYSRHLREFIFNNVTTCTMNAHRLQCSSSVSCGKFCIYYSSLRCRGISQQNILNMFTQDCEYNDRIVTQFYNNHFT